MALQCTISNISQSFHTNFIRKYSVRFNYTTYLHEFYILNNGIIWKLLQYVNGTETENMKSRDDNVHGDRENIIRS